MFTAHGIDRNNLQRTEREHTAQQLRQQQRQQQTAQPKRVDTQQPMFHSTRPSLGGGAFDAWALLVLAVFLLHRYHQRFNY